jgi:hypothetical protein
MCPMLNLSSHLTSLSGVARARKPPLPDGVPSCTRDRRGGDKVLTLRHLRSSMTLRRSSRLWPVSRTLRFWDICCQALLSARRRSSLTDDATSLRASLAWSWDRLPTEGSLRWLSADLSATTRSATLAPCCAKAIKGEPSDAKCWIDSKIV